ncbi:MAG: DUF3379 domain-containing protein [Oscillospiraceae bacterium]|nr:DUF3379 domain-containing protein [Oscillospiraceae bacterium]
MKSCAEYEMLISAFLDGEASEEERAEAAEHLASCSACQKYFDDLVALHDALDQMEEVPVPEDFAAEVMDRVRETPQETAGKTVLFPRWRRWAAMAACCAVAALGLWAFQVRAGNAEETGGARQAGQVTAVRSAPSMAQYDSASGGAEENGSELAAMLLEEPEAAPADSAGNTGGEPSQQMDRMELDAERCMEEAMDAASPAAALPKEAKNAFSGTVTAGGETARGWVEDELGLVWESGRAYPLTQEQLDALLEALEQAGEDFQVEPGEECLLMAG